VNVVLGLIREKAGKSDVKLAKEGDKKAFERLIAKYRQAMYRIAKGMLKNETDVEEALQNTVVKAIRGIYSLKNDDFIKTWLIKILMNECTTLLRVKRKIYYIEDVIGEEASVTDNHEKLELWEAVNLLEEELRSVTILFYYEDIPQKTIAEILGIPDGTVRSRLSRARLKLKDLLTIE
jgi:RNA polymerase sigma-70 factor, ECF subfamily